MGLGRIGAGTSTEPTPTTMDDALLQTIVERVLSVSSPERILLFGSAATGELSPSSDIDLLVLESEVDDARREANRIREVLRRLGKPFDVIVMTTERFEETKDVIGGLAYPASRYGRVVYEAAG